MRKFISGNEAVVEGALIAGCRFFGGYPITPSSEIAGHLSTRLPQIGGKYIQMEDEIGSLAACIGASLCGEKVMTATSGPGLSLMLENVGMAIMAEVPCVIVDVQRGGPSTGLATKVGQGDVFQVRWGSHGGYPVIALAPSTIAETVEMTIEAFNLAEKYRVPVFLMTDKVIGHMREDVDLESFAGYPIINRKVAPPDGEFLPYRAENLTDVPPMSPYGGLHVVRASSTTHDQRGVPTPDPEKITFKNSRLYHKIQDKAGEICRWEADLMPGADSLVVSFGISARSGKQAVVEARASGMKVNFLKILTLWPFPEEAISEAARGVNKVVVPELNWGQVALEVERVLGADVNVIRVNKTDGTIICPEEIIQVLNDAAAS
ncbi:2-oxoglutarate synthase subunit alpha [candidate division LCP-89 bacterium B3_LCP]|uniref:2-oxoglutarate synthase subunit alpha n=1 Tax=candidate division LCP-89 bacterium B3_LCP TaxID=2012998 RepID=A0A532UYI6_UNCL8|nr:MAG: 2-oxoglutarate synthase subunit alpha [candidate division LCP-89 bacterium B3_LCP]